MHRRRFLGAATLPLVAAAFPAVAAGDHKVPFTEEAYKQALASGKPFMLDFYASW